MSERAPRQHPHINRSHQTITPINHHKYQHNITHTRTGRACNGGTGLWTGREAGAERPAGFERRRQPAGSSVFDRVTDRETRAPEQITTPARNRPEKGRNEYLHTRGKEYIAEGRRRPEMQSGETGRRPAGMKKKKKTEKKKKKKKRKRKRQGKPQRTGTAGRPSP